MPKPDIDPAHPFLIGPAAPYTTIQEALDAVHAMQPVHPVAIEIEAGVYTEAIELTENIVLKARVPGGAWMPHTPRIDDTSRPSVSLCSVQIIGDVFYRDAALGQGGLGTRSGMVGFEGVRIGGTGKNLFFFGVPNQTLDVFMRDCMIEGSVALQTAGKGGHFMADHCVFSRTNDPLSPRAPWSYTLRSCAVLQGGPTKLVGNNYAWITDGPSRGYVDAGCYVEGSIYNEGELYLDCDHYSNGKGGLVTLQGGKVILGAGYHGKSDPMDGLTVRGTGEVEIRTNRSDFACEVGINVEYRPVV